MSRTWAMGVLLVCVLAPPPARAESGPNGPRAVLTIPRVDEAPVLEDYLNMKPNGRAEGRMAKVEGFIQYRPRDGEPATQRTEVYVGYDDKNFYAVFIAFDTERSKTRARLTRRDDVFRDDRVSLTLDTYQDRRRAYSFMCNPLGVQSDLRYAEGGGGSPFNLSFDTLWKSQGQLTPEGYVVWMAIPFKSLRFSAAPKQTWGIYFSRSIPRVDESAYWPRISSRISGRVNQAATLVGLENISPGRNMQVVPFGFFRSFRALDTVDPDLPQFLTKNADVDGGVDAKFVI